MASPISNLSVSPNQDKKQFPNPDSFEPRESSPDITHVKDKFPKIRDEAWLAQRLGNAITKRRMIIRFRQAKKAQPATAADRRSDDMADQASVSTPATSFISSSDEAMSQDIPDLDNLTFNGKKLEFGESIECPYCRTTQVLDTQAEWRQAFDQTQNMALKTNNWAESTSWLIFSRMCAPSKTALLVSLPLKRDGSLTR